MFSVANMQDEDGIFLFLFLREVHRSVGKKFDRILSKDSVLGRLKNESTALSGTNERKVVALEKAVASIFGTFW